MHHKQHGFHNKTTDKIHDKIDILKEIFNISGDKIEGLKDLIQDVKNEEVMMEAFLGLKRIMKKEQESIIKEVIQVKGGDLDKRY